MTRSNQLNYISSMNNIMKQLTGRERPAQLPGLETIHTASEDEDGFGTNRKLKKFTTSVPAHENSQEHIEVFSEFQITQKAQIDQSLTQSKTKSCRENFIQSSTKLFANQGFEIDPCKDMDHVTQVHYNDQLKDQTSPFDSHQIVQTLQVPSSNQSGLFLTVHLVTQNVLAEGITTQPNLGVQQPYLICQCGLHAQLDSADKQAEMPRFAEKCQYCEEKLETLYRCGGVKTQEKIGQEEPKICDFKACQRCFANNFMTIVHKHKLKNHAVWEPYVLDKKSSRKDETVEFFGGIKKVQRQKQKQIENTTIAVIGAWQRNGKSAPNCLKQYHVTDPLFFPKSDQKVFQNLTFIHTGEGGELFFFQKNSQGVQLSIIANELELDIFDKKPCTHYPDIFDLPLRGNKFTLQTDRRRFDGPDSIFKTAIMNQTPRLAGDYLIFSSKVSNSEGKVKMFENSSSTSFYNLRTNHEMVILNAILVLQIKIEDTIQEVTYLIKNEKELKIVRVSWDELVRGQLEFQIKQTSYTNPSSNAEWQLTKPESEELGDFLRSGEMIHGIIHSKGTRLTVIGQSSMSWVSYFLTSEDDQGVRTLREISDSNQSSEKPFTHFYDKEEDQLLILQGLQKVPEQSNDKQYQKFESLVLDLSHSQDDEEPGDEEEEKKQYFKITKCAVFLPIELLYGNELQNYSLRAISLTQDDFGRFHLSGFAQISLNQAIGSLATATKFVFLTNIAEKPKQSQLLDKSSSFIHTQTSHDHIDASFGYILPSQDHFIEYPILVQTTYHPKRNQILISNLTLNQPKILLSLEKYHFVSFVHSSLVDEDLEQSSQIYEDSNNFHAVKLHSGVIRIHILVSEENDARRALRLMWFEVSTIDSVSLINQVSPNNQPIEAVTAMFKSKVQTKSYRQLSFGLFKPKIELPQVQNLEQIKKVLIYRAKKSQSQRLDICLVFQTVDRVFPYLLFDNQRNKKINERIPNVQNALAESRVVPTSMVCGPDFSCFYVTTSKQGYKVTALYSEKNNTEKIRVDVIITQEDRIAKIAVLRDYKRKKILRLIVLDVSGKVREYELVKTHGLYVVGNPTKSLSIPKKQYQKVEGLLKNQPWAEFVLQEASIIAMNEDDSNFMVQPFSDYLCWELLDKRNKKEGERHAIAARSVPWIDKVCLITQVGSYSFLRVKPNVESNRLDISSEQINQQAKGIHTLGQKIVLELSIGKPNSSLFVYYNSADLMLSYVNYHQNTQIISGPNSIGNYYATKKRDQNLLLFSSELQRASESETDLDLYIYRQDGHWKKQFSYVDSLVERMHDFINIATGQADQKSFDYWCWREISQTTGIARESGETAGPIMQEDGTLTMVYFMCPKDLSSSQRSQFDAGQGAASSFYPQTPFNKFERNEFSDLIQTFQHSLLRGQFDKKVLTFSEDELEAYTRIFKVAVRQDVAQNLNPILDKHRHTFIEANPSTELNEHCVSYIIETSGQVKAKSIFTKNYLVWVTEKGRLYFAKLAEIDQNQRIFIQDVNASGFKKELREDFSIKTLGRLLKEGVVQHTRCGIINLKQIVSNFYFQDFSLFVLNEMDKNFVIGKEKVRQDLIQIQFNGVSTIWDLEEMEEITYLIGADNQFDVKNFARTGHLIRSTKQSTIGAPAQLSCFRPNINQTLFVCQSLKSNESAENLIYCLRLYCQRDLHEIFNIQRHLNDGLSIRKINPSLFTANIMNQTFFYIFSKQHQVMNFVADFLSQLELDSVIDEENEVEQKFDHIYLRKLYQTLLCPISPEVQSVNIKLVSSMFRRVSTRAEEKQELPPVQQNILQKTLKDDGIMFNFLLKIMLNSSEVRLSNLVTNLANFQILFRSRSSERNAFMEKAALQTNATRRITSLEAKDDADIMFFGSNTTMLNEKEIRRRFSEEYLCPEEDKECFEYKVVIMETEWLTDVGKFYIAMKNADPLIYDNNVIKFLRQELDFKARVIWLMFIPFCLYMAMTIFYFCKFVTDETQFHLGFFGGKPFSIALRVGITVLTGYFLFVELMQVKHTGAQYLRNYHFYQYVISYFLNFFIILEHSLTFVGLENLRLAQFASLATLLMWANLYFWMRLFKNTAMYVDMINQTIYDIRFFMWLVVIEVCAFGNAMMILNYIEARDYLLNPQSEDYEPLYQKAFGAPLIDAIIGQYTLGLGNFDTANFNVNPSVTLCWIYFITATFFTQILFINMIIALMGTTYENVRENADRNALIMQTRILSDFILLAPSQNRFKDMRYLYIAERVKEESQSQFDSVQSNRNINNVILEGFENSKELIEEVKLQQVKLIDSLQTVQKDSQQHEKEFAYLTHDLKNFIREQREEAKIREQNQVDLLKHVEQLKNEVSGLKRKLAQQSLS